MSPKVSVIISTHNRADLLPRAVESVLCQTFKDLELLIINDASTDKTESVVKDFQDPRVIYIRHEQCLGGPVARNTGIEKSRGEYIAFLDDDDEWLPEKLSLQVEHMNRAETEVGVIYTGSETLESPGERLVETYTPDRSVDIKKALYAGSAIGGVSKVMVRRECFDRVGVFDEGLKSCQDWDMWFRISQYYDFDCVPKILVKYYVHKGQISDDFSKLIPGRTAMVEKHYEEFQKYPEKLVIHLKRLGKLHCINGTWGDGVKWFGKAIRIRPLEIFKIFAWSVFELPKVKFFSRHGKFRKYRRS